MIYIKRSIDSNRDVTWIASDFDEEAYRSRILYAGRDVNGAVKAAVAAGMPNTQACCKAQAEINRCNLQATNDVLVVN